jgi:hypothetical protein
VAILIVMLAGALARILMRIVAIGIAVFLREARRYGGAARMITAISERTTHSIITAAQDPPIAPLFRLDCAIDLDRKPDCADCQRRLGWQRLVPFELAIGKRGADGFLDFTLRGNADLFEKLAYAHNEHFFVHDRFSKTRRKHGGQFGYSVTHRHAPDFFPGLIFRNYAVATP